MAIYFIRHGETDANIANIFAGQGLDSPLTQRGLLQAQQAGQALSSFGITRIVSSDLQRTRITAFEISKSLGVEIVEIDDRIIEYDDGSLTGHAITAIRSVDLIAADGAEDPLLFSDRITSFLKDHKDSLDNVLMVSHGGVAKMIEAGRLGIDPTLFFDLEGIGNATAIKLDLTWL